MTFETGMIPQFDETNVRTLARPSERSAPAWLPAPPARTSATTSRRLRSPAKATRSIWIQVEHDSLAEKLLFGSLALAAVAAIGYGFVGLLNMVQGWGAFQSWVGQLVQ